MVWSTEYARVARKIRRAACAGLPVRLFSETLFDLTAQVIPNTDIKVLLLGEQGHTKGITRHLDTLKWGPRYRDVLMMPKAESRFRPLSELLPQGQTVFTQEERTLPGFHRGVAYNEFFRHLELHHVVSSVLRSRGRVVGVYPLWRPPGAAAFSARDAQFLRYVAPWIAHGVARGLNEDDRQETASSTAAWIHRPDQERGFLLLDAQGRVLSINRRAQSLFMRRVEGSAASDEHFFERWCDVGKALQEVSAVLARVFGTAGDALELPVKILPHPSGCTLRLSAWRLTESGSSAVTLVEVEEVIPRAARLQQLGLLYGFSGRESQVLERLAQGMAVAGLARDLGISASTAHTLTERLLEKAQCASLTEFWARNPEVRGPTGGPLAGAPYPATVGRQRLG